ncbi:MAG: GntR family transcriptional regulator, partial [Bryobacterales bacterium]|nr:GntR family transcriptional regulator [Bryobacterales bacterium]
LKDRAVGAIRDAIFTGQLAPGDPLRELHLAKELQVSQPTVREALMELERSGLVVRKANIETTVANMTTTEIRDRIELRVMLEKAALRKAVLRLTPDDYTILEDRLAALGKAVASGDYHEVAQTDLSFHSLLWERSGNMALLHGLECLTTPLFAFVSIMRNAWADDLSGVVAQHREIIEELRAGDLDALDETITAHVSTTYQPFLQSSAVDFRSYILNQRTYRQSSSSASG